jgi:hypothetical protein
MPSSWLIGGERCSKRTAGIASRRLDPDALELAIPQHLAVCNAIKSNASGETEVFGPGLSRDRTRKPQHDFLGHRLN